MIAVKKGHDSFLIAFSNKEMKMIMRSDKVLPCTAKNGKKELHFGFCNAKLLEEAAKKKHNKKLFKRIIDKLCKHLGR